MKTNTVVRVFLASPMDVVEERKVFRETINKINATIGKNIGTVFECIGWEDDVVPGTGVDAQDVVNSQIKQDYSISGEKSDS